MFLSKKIKIMVDYIKGVTLNQIHEPTHDAEYLNRVHHELESYKEETPSLSIPPIFSYWASKFLTARLTNVMGTGGIEEYFASQMSNFMKRGEPNNIASIGCGDCISEIKIAELLLEDASVDFKFYCYDISKHTLDRAHNQICAKNLSDHFVLVEQDLNRIDLTIRFNAIMANHSLHHFQNLENIFQAVKSSLVDDGGFVVSDMIGRNGHMRWPEAMEIIEAVWAKCPDRYKYNHLLHRFEKNYDNWDCSIGNFEGIRSQDILPLLYKYFHFSKFVAFGNIPDIFIDRTFGPNLRVDAMDCEFIDSLEELNTKLINDGIIKPTHMFGVLLKNETVTQSDMGWAPEYCIRLTDPTFFKSAASDGKSIDAIVTEYVRIPLN